MYKDGLIPCKECIVYAICKNKKYICCEQLYDYTVHISFNYLDEIDEYWRHLKLTLPYITRVSSERRIIVREGRRYAYTEHTMR